MRTCSIIIPVHNKVEYTRQCLEALIENTPDELYEVIIVDNGSTDGTKEFLNCLDGDLKIITNKTNLGFARACNQGASVAQGKYLVFLNNDTVPQPNWLEEMVEVVEAHQEVGIVGSKLLYPDGTIQHAGVVCDGRNPYHIYVGFPADHPAVNKLREFPFVSAACMLIRRDLFNLVGGFDEGYINGYEDVDLCLKVRNLKKKVMYCPTSVLYHYESVSEDRNNRRRAVNDQRNFKLLQQKWSSQLIRDDISYYRADGFDLARLRFKPGPNGHVVIESTPSHPKVSIIIPVHNNLAYTRQCLEALIQNTPDELYEVIIVDNGSTDGTKDFLKSLRGDVEIITNQTNLGFAKACNQGAKAARGDYLVFLNNDTIPQKGWLSELVKLAERDEKIAVIGSKLIYPGTNRIQHAGIEIMKDGIPDHLFRGVDADDPRVNQLKEVQMVTGACMLVRRELFLKLGMFDEGYLNGVEDVDFCLRAREEGYRVMYCPTSVLYHYEGVSQGRFDNVRGNLERFQKKWGARLPKEKIKIRWEGPQLVDQGLAVVNRGLCLQLAKRDDVELSVIPCREEDSGPKINSRRFGPIEERMNRPLSGPAQFHIRHFYPPDFSPPKGGYWIMIQPWEFGSLPKVWVKPIQEQVDEVWVPTNYVRQVYLDSGVSPEKVFVIPNGVNPDVFRPDAPPIRLDTDKRFKFLFVGGTIYRKGIDILLDVYINTFSSQDDVVLVIKDIFKESVYQGQSLDEKICQIQRDPKSPALIYFNRRLSEDQMAGLYTACDCLVHPYRGEGFALPVLEAMACGLPVIVTAGGATDDFVDEQTGYRIPATKRILPKPEITLPFKEGHRIVNLKVPSAGDLWFLEPDRTALAEKMRWVYEHPQAAREVGQRASRRVRADFTWARAAEKVMERLQELKRKPILRYQMKSIGAYKESADLSVAYRRYADAIRSYKRYLATSGDNNARILTTIATCYALQGHYQLAARGYRAALEVDPECEEAKRQLSILRSRLENRDPQENPSLNDVPGITKRGCVDIGRPCNIDCIFCYHRFDDRRKRRFLPAEEIKRRMKRFREEFGNQICDFTGGEPTIHPDIVELVEYGSKIGNRVCIITHGQWNRLGHIDDIIDAGLHEFLISIQGTEKIHNQMTGTRDGFSKVMRALEHLRKRGFTRWRVNTVATKYNMHDLPKLAELITSLDDMPSNFNFIVFSPLSGWAEKFDIDFQAKHSQLAPFLKEAIEILMSKGIWVNVRYFPFCLLRGFEQCITCFPQIIYDPFEWDYRAYLNLSPQAIARIFRIGKKNNVFGETEAHVFFNAWSQIQQSRLYRKGKECIGCSHILICDGLSYQYAKRFGFGELNKYNGGLIMDPIYHRRAYAPRAVQG